MHPQCGLSDFGVIYLKPFWWLDCAVDLSGADKTAHSFCLPPAAEQTVRGGRGMWQ